MVEKAWIVLISVVLAVIVNIILLIANKKYRRRLANIYKKEWVIVVNILILFPILLYIIGTCVSVIKQGENFVAYYNPGGKEMFYYNGCEYYRIQDEEMEKTAAEYGEGCWEYTDMYITDRKIDFPYWEYCIPRSFWDKPVLPGEQEPIYIMVWQQNEQVYYIRDDVRDAMEWE